MNVPLAVAMTLSSSSMIIIAGIALNGRDRDNDSEILLKIIEKIMGEKQ
jgi:hypothetical protein